MASFGLKCVLLAAVAWLPSISSYEILVVFPMPSGSHGILGDGYVRLLLEAGHHVTYMSPFAQKNHPNLTWVDISTNKDLLPDDVINISSILKKEVDPNDMSMFFEILMGLGATTYGNEHVQKLMMDPNKTFDLIIIEWLFSEIGCGLAAVLNCPYIWFSTVDPHWMVTQLIDERLNPAYNADTTSGNLPPFTFVQRVQELWNQIFFSLILAFSFAPREAKLYDEIFGPAARARGIDLPSLDEVKYNASLMLGNSHVSLGHAVRLPQNYKPVGGYHIDPDVKPLPEDLKKILDNAKNGVIYFSMGSNVKSKGMPDEMKRDLLKMFGSLDRTVIWKFEDVLPNLPKNVHILKWAPQPSILAHPNTILFITHGGLLSTTETVYFGVPIIGVPVFADQFNNVDRAVKRGFAKRVDLSYNLASELKTAIEEILGNPRYTERVKELSLIYHDRPVSPGRELVHWVEHVVRTRGASHLRSPALHMPFYQKMYLDLAALILLALIAIKTILKRIFSSKKKTDSRKKKN